MVLLPSRSSLIPRERHSVGPPRLLLNCSIIPGKLKKSQSEAKNASFSVHRGRYDPGTQPSGYPRCSTPARAPLPTGNPRVIHACLRFVYQATSSDWLSARLSCIPTAMLNCVRDFLLRSFRFTAQIRMSKTDCVRIGSEPRYLKSPRSSRSPLI